MGNFGTMSLKDAEGCSSDEFVDETSSMFVGVMSLLPEGAGAEAATQLLESVVFDPVSA